MKYSSGPKSLNLKLTLVVIGAVIAFATLYYTQNLVSKLQQSEKEIVQLYASGLEFATKPETEGEELNFILENIINRIDFPLILTDNKEQVSETIGIGYKNIEHDTNITSEQLKSLLQNKVKELAKSHLPIDVRTPDGKILSRIYYGDSEIIKQLRYYPFLQIIFAVLFIAIAYSSFSYIKRSEQSNIWVGMSKETAHQLGTPISSLMGWNEILKMNYNSPDKVLDTSEEIESDLNRLNKITKRFSKIGSKPELKTETPYIVIERVIGYFQRRLPHLGKSVVITLEGEKNAYANLNTELFEWVAENLIKNALDSIEHKEGKIHFRVHKNKNKVEIEISDNGKGIESGIRKDIFRPGYSTKKRGWGLGLSLSKRIIEDYHKGKIFVKSSIINSGTTFKIQLSATEEIT
ncbi:MAG: integral membrane sensor signal transduction histidine kinase [Ignavibacteria bacterium]|nr:MAG: integral membrane sensor signal transduction histidine kinase [Ignavibacteria bacterium]KAF0160404.1 MAG: integral membrane sensor signal transduction histidine kinase [Ignavibacteria bacterium]